MKRIPLEIYHKTEEGGVKPSDVNDLVDNVESRLGTDSVSWSYVFPSN